MPFSERSDDSSRRAASRRTPRNGRITMARPMMPIPPIHCPVERQSRIDGAWCRGPHHGRPGGGHARDELEIGVDHREVDRFGQERQRRRRRNYEPRDDREQGARRGSGAEMLCPLVVSTQAPPKTMVMAPVAPKTSAMPSPTASENRAMTPCAAPTARHIHPRTSTAGQTLGSKP